MSISLVRTLVVPPCFGRVCVWNIWTDVKLLPFCIVSRCRGRQHFTGTVSNEATSEMGYPAWPAGRTCNPIISFSLTWHGAKPRTPIPDVSVHALHVCRNLVFIHLEISTFAAILIFLLAPVHILIWGLFEQVSDRGPVCRNSFLLITYAFEEIYLGSIILFNCTLWDSVPDGSLQWSSSVLVCVKALCGWGEQVLRLPRQTKDKVVRDKVVCERVDATRCHNCHACHAKTKVDVPKCHAGTIMEGGCHQAPRLPPKVPQRHRRPAGPKRATRASPVP